MKCKTHEYENIIVSNLKTKTFRTQLYNFEASVPKNSGILNDKKLITNRHTNPLNPAYKLPTYTNVVVPPPKFIRDQISTSDIIGSSPTMPRKEIKNDYKFQSCGSTKKIINHQYNYLNYSDVNGKKSKNNYSIKIENFEPAEENKISYDLSKMGVNSILASIFISG